MSKWYPDKTNAFVDLIIAHYSVLFPNSSARANSKRQADAKWTEIRADVNRDYGRVKHDVEQCKNKWKNVKKAARAYNAERQRDMVRVSGGGVPETEADPLYDKVLDHLRTVESEALVCFV